MALHLFTFWNIGTTLTWEHNLPFTVDICRPIQSVGLARHSLAFVGILSQPSYTPVRSCHSWKSPFFALMRRPLRGLNCTSFRWVGHSSLRQKVACPKAHPKEGETARLQGKLDLLTTPKNNNTNYLYVTNIMWLTLYTLYKDVFSSCYDHPSQPPLQQS